MADVINWLLKKLASLQPNFYGSIELIIEGGKIVRMKTTCSEKPPAVDNAAG